MNRSEAVNARRKIREAARKHSTNLDRIMSESRKQGEEQRARKARKVRQDRLAKEAAEAVRQRDEKEKAEKEARSSFRGFLFRR